MGKSRSRAAKAASVFSIARSGAVKAKAKGKARPVTSGLKQINIRNAEKVRTINKAFAEVQKEEVQQLSKGTAAQPQKSHQVIPLQEPANVDAATSLLAQL
uniref:Ribosomal biogenesis factor n=1 Tax=Calidris pygmaea TaxID=425635 RepID=A0A8C3PSJ3_9CHAR